MNIADFLNKEGDKRGFSFEILPPLKGNGTAALFRTIDALKEFAPRFINITTHHSEYVYKELENGLLTRQRVRRRPGTVAIAGAIQNKYDIPVIPHIICSGASKEDIEYELLDLQFLGISNVLVLRGDKAKEDRQFTPTSNGHTHATELLEQINQFNDGFFFDGTAIKHPGEKFCCGVACYPEKHEEAPNLEQDMLHLLEKQQLGAAYAVTQLFYDNKKFYEFVDKARQMGVTIPIIPALKPFAKLSQLTVVPKTFHCDIPEELAGEVLKCKSDEDAKALGIEWTTSQVKDLFEHGYNNVHFFTVSAVESVKQIARTLF